MNIKSQFLGIMLASLLSGCAGGGPTNVEAMEAVYSVYFMYPSITDKVECAPTPNLQAEGHTNVWLIRYNFKYEGAQETEGGMVLIKSGDPDFPWQVYQSNTFNCPTQ